MDSIQNVQTDLMFNPAEFRMTPEVMNRQMAVYGDSVQAGFEPDSLVEQMRIVERRIRESVK